MNNWKWDRQQGKFIQVNLGGQPGPHGQPHVGAPGGWGQPPTYSPSSQSEGPPRSYDDYAYNQQPSTTAAQAYGGFPGYERYPGYGVPQPGPYSQHAPQQVPHPFTQFPHQPGAPQAGQTGFFPQQYGQNSILGMPPSHTSNVPSNLNFNQNQQREKGMRKGSGQQQRKRQDVEKDGHRDNKSSRKNVLRGDHRGRGRGHGRRRGRGGRRGGNTDEKDSEVCSECEDEDNDDSEDYSDSEDTDTEITEKSKPKNQEFHTSTDSLTKEKTSQKKSMQDPGDHTDGEPTEPPEENEVFEYLIKEVGGPTSLKNIAIKKLFPKDFDIPSWFHSHQRRFIMFENKEKTYQFIIPMYREATFCLDYNRLRKQEKCDQSDCPHAHICKDFIGGSCKKGEKCPFSHNFYDRANTGLISKLGLDIFSNEEIRLIYSQRFPHVCGMHTPSHICRLPACAYLHICKNNLFGRCENGSDCRLSHTFETEQNQTVLKVYQLTNKKEPYLKKVIFMYAFTSKKNTHPKDISPHGSEESILDKTNMSQNRLNRGAGSTINLQNEQKSKSHSRSKSSDVRKGHRRSSTSSPHEMHGKDSTVKNQMNSGNEEVKPSSRKRDLQEEGIQEKDKSVGRAGSQEPKSVNPDTDVGGVKPKGPRPRHRMNNEGDRASTDPVLGTDAAQSNPICDLYLVDRCKTASCKCHHHDSIKLPYIWQIQMFNSWLTLDKLKTIEAEKAYCNKRSTIQTTIFYEGHNYNATLELDTLTAVVMDGGSSSFTIHTRARRLSTKSYAEGSKPSAEESFKTQWRWFYSDESGSFCLLEPELLQFTLEQKFTRKCQDTYLFSRGNYKFRYCIDFKSMEQINMETEERQKLLRRPLFVSAEDVETKHYPEKIVIPAGIKVPLPNTWVPWDLAHAFELVELKQNSAEFKKVERSFSTTLNSKEFHISYIYRVQNMELWMAYDGQKKSMKVSLERAGQTKEVDERNLFHGTDSMDTVQGICTNSFDFRLCGKHGTRYGKGAYFARDAKYSHSYTNNSNTTAVRYMFSAKVLVGEYTTGSSNYTRPPEKPGGTAHQLFDSCVDNVDNPAIFVVFDLKQCYPEYLICYKSLEEFTMEEATSVRPNKYTTPSQVEHILSLSLLEESTQPTSNINTSSSLVENDNVLALFDPLYSPEPLERASVRPNKNARPSQVTRIEPSPSQDQSTQSASSIHRSSSPVEIHRVSDFSYPHYSREPPKSVSALINNFNNISISSRPVYLPFSDSPLQSSRRSSGASSSQTVYQRHGECVDDIKERVNQASSDQHKPVQAVPDTDPQDTKQTLMKPLPPPKPQVSIKPQVNQNSPVSPKP